MNLFNRRSFLKTTAGIALVGGVSLKSQAAGEIIKKESGESPNWYIEGRIEEIPNQIFGSALMFDVRVDRVSGKHPYINANLWEPGESLSYPKAIFPAETKAADKVRISLVRDEEGFYRCKGTILLRGVVEVTALEPEARFYRRNGFMP